MALNYSDPTAERISQIEMNLETIESTSSDESDKMSEIVQSVACEDPVSKVDKNELSEIDKFLSSQPHRGNELKRFDQDLIDTQLGIRNAFPKVNYNDTYGDIPDESINEPEIKKPGLRVPAMRCILSHPDKVQNKFNKYGNISYHDDSIREAQRARTAKEKHALNLSKFNKKYGNRQFQLNTSDGTVMGVSPRKFERKKSLPEEFNEIGRHAVKIRNVKNAKPRKKLNKLELPNVVDKKPACFKNCSANRNVDVQAIEKGAVSQSQLRLPPKSQQRTLKRTNLDQPSPVPGPSGLTRSQQKALLERNQKNENRPGPSGLTRSQQKELMERNQKIERSTRTKSPIPGPSGLTRSQQKELMERNQKNDRSTRTKSPIPGPSGLTRSQQKELMERNQKNDRSTPTKSPIPGPSGLTRSQQNELLQQNRNRDYKIESQRTPSPNRLNRSQKYRIQNSDQLESPKLQNKSFPTQKSVDVLTVISPSANQLKYGSTRRKLFNDRSSDDQMVESGPKKSQNESPTRSNLTINGPFVPRVHSSPIESDLPRSVKSSISQDPVSDLARSPNVLSVKQVEHGTPKQWKTHSIPLPSHSTQRLDTLRPQESSTSQDQQIDRSTRSQRTVQSAVPKKSQTIRKSPRLVCPRAKRKHVAADENEYVCPISMVCSDKDPPCMLRLNESEESYNLENSPNLLPKDEKSGPKQNKTSPSKRSGHYGGSATQRQLNTDLSSESSVPESHVSRRQTRNLLSVPRIHRRNRSINERPQSGSQQNPNLTFPINSNTSGYSTSENIADTDLSNMGGFGETYILPSNSNARRRSGHVSGSATQRQLNTDLSSESSVPEQSHLSRRNRSINERPQSGSQQNPNLTYTINSNTSENSTSENVADSDLLNMARFGETYILPSNSNERRRSGHVSVNRMPNVQNRSISNPYVPSGSSGQSVLRAGSQGIRSGRSPTHGSEPSIQHNRAIYHSIPIGSNRLRNSQRRHEQQANSPGSAVPINTFERNYGQPQFRSSMPIRQNPNRRIGSRASGGEGGQPELGSQRRRNQQIRAQNNNNIDPGVMMNLLLDPDEDYADESESVDESESDHEAQPNFEAQPPRIKMPRNFLEVPRVPLRDREDLECRIPEVAETPLPAGRIRPPNKPPSPPHSSSGEDKAKRNEAKKPPTPPKLSPRPWMPTEKTKKKKEFTLTAEQKALVLDNYYPGLIHDAVNQNADFNEIAKKFVTPETAVDGNKAEKGMSLLEAFDTRVKYEQVTLKSILTLAPVKNSKGKVTKPNDLKPVYGPLPHPVISDYLLEDHVRVSAMPDDLQQFIRATPENDPVRAISCLSRAERLNNYYKEYKAAQAAARLASPENIEKAAVQGVKTFLIDSLSSETKTVSSGFYKALELVSYVGITKPS